MTVLSWGKVGGAENCDTKSILIMSKSLYLYLYLYLYSNSTHVPQHHY